MVWVIVLREESAEVGENCFDVVMLLNCVEDFRVVFAIVNDFMVVVGITVLLDLLPELVDLCVMTCIYSGVSD